MSGTTHNKPLTQLRDWRRGDALTHGRLNDVHDVVRGLQQGVDQPMQVPSVARGGVEAAAGGAKVGTFQLVNVQTDWLTCRSIDANGVVAPADEPTLLAKPYLLQRTPFHNKIRNDITLVYVSPTERTAIRGLPGNRNSETQVIVPSYVVGDMLQAWIAVYTGVEDQEENPIMWQAEYAGRAWARKTRQ